MTCRIHTGFRRPLVRLGDLPRADVGKWATAFFLTAIMLVSCGKGLVTRDGNGVEVRYRVKYLEAKPVDVTAEIMYLDPSGRWQSQRVRLPWRSQIMTFGAQRSVGLKAEVDPGLKGALQCSWHAAVGFHGVMEGSSRNRRCKVLQSVANIENSNDWLDEPGWEFPRS